MFLNDAWYVASEPNELASGPIARTILNQRVVIFRTAAGELGALEDRCPHRLVELSLGAVVGDTLRCPYHGARFAVDGSCAAIPGQDTIPSSVRVRHYPAIERLGYCWIWMGVPENADEKLLPRSYWPSNAEGWIGSYGLFESMKVDYRLLNDNVIDITHAEFVHPDSFGGEEARYFRQAKLSDEYRDRAMTYSIDSDGIRFRVQVKSLGDEGGPLWRQLLAQSRSVESWPDPIDFIMDVDWIAPSYCSFTLSVRPEGKPDAEPAIMCNLHAAVPETETTTHYFFRSLRNFGDGSHDDALAQAANYIFGQDKPILESQQRLIGNRDLFDHQTVSFKGDRLPFEARRILSRLILHETGINACSEAPESELNARGSDSRHRTRIS